MLAMLIFDCSTAIQVCKVTFSVICRHYTTFGFVVNMKKGKSAAMFCLRGAGKRQVEFELYNVSDSRIDFDAGHTNQSLHIALEYKHLGCYLQHNGAQSKQFKFHSAVANSSISLFDERFFPGPRFLSERKAQSPKPSFSVSCISASTPLHSLYPVLTKDMRLFTSELAKRSLVGNRTPLGSTSPQMKFLHRPLYHPFLALPLQLGFGILRASLQLGPTFCTHLLRSRRPFQTLGTALFGATLPSCAQSQMIVLPQTLTCSILSEIA